MLERTLSKFYGRRIRPSSSSNMMMMINDKTVSKRTKKIIQQFQNGKFALENESDQQSDIDFDYFDDIIDFHDPAPLNEANLNKLTKEETKRKKKIFTLKNFFRYWFNHKKPRVEVNLDDFSSVCSEEYRPSSFPDRFQSGKSSWNEGHSFYTVHPDDTLEVIDLEVLEDDIENYNLSLPPFLPKSHSTSTTCSLNMSLSKESEENIRKMLEQSVDLDEESLSSTSRTIMS